VPWRKENIVIWKTTKLYARMADIRKSVTRSSIKDPLNISPISSYIPRIELNLVENEEEY
jgi:hypothetical protein